MRIQHENSGNKSKQFPPVFISVDFVVVSCKFSTQQKHWNCRQQRIFIHSRIFMFMLFHIDEEIHQIELIYSFHAHHKEDDDDSLSFQLFSLSKNANNLIEAAQNDKNSARQLNSKLWERILFSMEKFCDVGKLEMWKKLDKIMEWIEVIYDIFLLDLWRSSRAAFSFNEFSFAFTKVNISFDTLYIIWINGISGLRLCKQPRLSRQQFHSQSSSFLCSAQNRPASDEDKETRFF